MITLAVLIPAPIGFHLFIRWPRDRLRRSTSVVLPSDLDDVLRALGDPLMIVLLGTRHIDLVADQVLDFADLIAIPQAWLRRVPKRDLLARARVASHIAAAHRKGPVHHYLSKDNDYQNQLPF